MGKIFDPTPICHKIVRIIYTEYHITVFLYMISYTPAQTVILNEKDQHHNDRVVISNIFCSIQYQLSFLLKTKKNVSWSVCWCIPQLFRTDLKRVKKQQQRAARTLHQIWGPYFNYWLPVSFYSMMIVNVELCSLQILQLSYI